VRVGGSFAGDILFPSLIAGAGVRIVTTGGDLLRELRLEPDRLYFGLGGRLPVHNVLRQVSSMS